MVPPFGKTVLPNGLRVVTEYMPSAESVALGLFVTAGPEKEPTDREGITHFIEHSLFKGTHRRSARQIAEEVDSVGGELNGFTERECTCIYARVLAEHLPLAADVLCDMLLNPSFRPDDLEREKQVVLDEIRQYEDTPHELVHELVPQTMWEGHPLGRALLGSVGSIESLTPEEVRSYFAQEYHPANIIAVAAGRVEHKCLADMMAHAFSADDPGGADPVTDPPPVTGREKLVARRTEQVHFCLATPAFPEADDARYPLAIVDEVLGAGASSRLFQEIRESRGLAYGVGSYTMAFRRAGAFVITASVSPSNLAKVLELSRAERERFRRDGPTDAELARAKEHIKGSAALALETTGARVRRLAGCEMYWGRPFPVEESLAKIEAVKRADVMAAAEQVFDPGRENYVAIGPFGS
jgi:predicted Zn-dependent peptidase